MHHTLQIFHHVWRVHNQIYFFCIDNKFFYPTCQSFEVFDDIIILVFILKKKLDSSPQNEILKFPN